MSSHNLTLTYGAELIYMPKAGGGAPRKVWFLSLPSGSITLPLGSARAFTTDDPDITRTYNDIMALVDLQARDQRKFQSLSIVRVEDLSFLHRYSDKRLAKLQRVYGFLSNAQFLFSRSRQICLLPGMASTELGRSAYFHRLWKWPRLIRTRFVLNTAFTLMFGIVKIPLAVLIFFYDLVRVAFAQYSEFRGSTARYASARRRQRLAQAFQSQEDDAKLAREVSAAREDLIKTRENYTKLNLTLLTLLLSVTAFFVSGYFAIDKINRLSQQASSIESQLISSAKENADLARKNAELSAKILSLESINALLTSIVPEGIAARAIEASKSKP